MTLWLDQTTRKGRTRGAEISHNAPHTTAPRFLTFVGLALIVIAAAEAITR